MSLLWRPLPEGQGPAVAMCCPAQRGAELKPAPRAAAPWRSPGPQVVCNYVAMTPQGRVFDSSLDRGTPYQFRYGVGNVIPGGAGGAGAGWAGEGATGASWRAVTPVGSPCCTACSLLRAQAAIQREQQALGRAAALRPERCVSSPPHASPRPGRRPGRGAEHHAGGRAAAALHPWGARLPQRPACGRREVSRHAQGVHAAARGARAPEDLLLGLLHCAAWAARHA